MGRTTDLSPAGADALRGLCARVRPLVEAFAEPSFVEEREAIVPLLALGQVAKQGAWSGTWIMLLDRAAAA